LFLVFFFFQAEDGIRDGHVTGVQTCALPILFSSRLSQVCQVPGGVRRNRLDSGYELSQRSHEFFLSAIPLPNEVLSQSSVIACHSNDDWNSSSGCRATCRCIR